MYLQNKFPDFSVDVEYNRLGAHPKTLNLPEERANARTRSGVPLVVPDIIVHKRGAEGPNLLILELKKTSNRESRACDQMRVRAFCRQLGYAHAALVECEIRPGTTFEVRVVEWL
jgi:hypothetical protein